MDLAKFHYMDLTKFQVQLRTDVKEEEDNSQEESAHPNLTIQYLKPTPKRHHKKYAKIIPTKFQFFHSL